MGPKGSKIVHNVTPVIPESNPNSHVGPIFLDII